MPFYIRYALNRLAIHILLLMILETVFMEMDLLHIGNSESISEFTCIFTDMYSCFARYISVACV
jgi:hypothetical protein